MRIRHKIIAVAVNLKELELLEQSEPERLEERADAWECAATVPGARLLRLVELACQARKAAANLRAMRAARLRMKAGSGL